MGLCCLQRKIHKTELLFLTQICTKSFVDLGFAPDPTAGAYSAPRPSSCFRVCGCPGNGKEGGEGKGKGKRRKRRG